MNRDHPLNLRIFSCFFVIQGQSQTHKMRSLPLLGEVCEDECAFLWQQFILLHSELLQELASGHGEDGLEQAAAEHLSGLIARQAVVTLGDMAVAQPPGSHKQK